MSTLSKIVIAAEELGAKNPGNTALKAYIIAYPTGRTASQLTLADFDAYMQLYGSPYNK